MKWTLSELKEKASNGMAIDSQIDIKDDLMHRHEDLIDVDPFKIKGIMVYDNQSVIANIQVTGDLTLPSSRSLEPVKTTITFDFNERYVPLELADQFPVDGPETVIELEDDIVNLDKAVADYVLLNLPLQVLTDEEASGEKFPTGNDWQVITEEAYSENIKGNEAFNNSKMEELLTQLQEQESNNDDSH